MKGKIDGEETGVVLSTDEIHEIGKYALMDGSYGQAVEWLQIANDLINAEKPSERASSTIHPTVFENNLELSIAIVRFSLLSKPCVAVLQHAFMTHSIILSSKTLTSRTPASLLLKYPEHQKHSQDAERAY